MTHEMGHGICQEKNERRADDYGTAATRSQDSRLQPDAGAQASCGGAESTVGRGTVDDRWTSCQAPCDRVYSLEQGFKV